MKYMDFFSKVGNILGKSGTRAADPLLLGFQSISQPRLFVGRLPFGVDDNGLKEAFSKYGNVVEANVIKDRETGKPRGFGFVTFNLDKEASRAIRALDGRDFDGQRIRVNYARSR
ncbi:PREDICTED: glycine-rich RNA-binding protein 5, mitochondrial-like [Tarenaya hassleriana]|uniref:glycine-rich RNA-binding protein 5, mitochondrial-like n=1 Tax=Tarenaya hassleriana TaxID=28532 RepID=UPI00053C7FA4|nr:PREDICTED: glycine-rich RNA-binding protein 5, mitochondrial-like [Tarenaya hassleriana]XP_010537395.1 PREDICTED: glycine-rich RNA-binding protein 5, mitochondrial-like [Tarenaya hassleriana]